MYLPLNVSAHKMQLFFFFSLPLPLSYINVAWGLGLAQARVHAFLSVKVVK